MNQAFISHIRTLYRDTSALNSEAYADLHDKYIRASHYRSDVLESSRFQLLPLLISGKFPSVLNICSESPQTFLLVLVLNSARRCVKAADFQKAEGLYHWSSLICPGSFEVYYEWSELKRKMQEIDAAIALLQKAVNATPQIIPSDRLDTQKAVWQAQRVSGAYADLGALQLEIGKLNESVAALRKCLEFMPEDKSPWAYQLLGIGCYRLGMFDEARSALGAALKIKPDLRDARDYLDRIHAMKQ